MCSIRGKSEDFTDTAEKHSLGRTDKLEFYPSWRLAFKYYIIVITGNMVECNLCVVHVAEYVAEKPKCFFPKQTSNA